MRDASDYPPLPTTVQIGHAHLRDAIDRVTRDASSGEVCRMTSTSLYTAATPVRLRICDGEGERILAAAVPVLEQVFAPRLEVRPGTEISLADADRTLVALALGRPEPGANGEAGEFLLSRVNGEHAALSGPVSRREALRLFREFISLAASETTQEGRVTQ